MAGALKLKLKFFDQPVGVPGNQDCGVRTAILPLSLPRPGDDFVWEARDFDGFRMAMLEELAARFPERTQWTPADLEVVLVEVLAWALDQLSDMLDRVTAEAYIETARRPESVRRLLSLIGFEADAGNWTRNPVLMEAARRAGPKSVHRQRRMVNVEDYAEGMELHPFVRRAVSSTRWNGSWHCVLITVILWNWESLNSRINSKKFPPNCLALLKDFHKQYGLPDIDEEAIKKMRVIDSLKAWSDSRRMAGQEILFVEAKRVGVDIGLNLTLAPQYYRSEVVQAVRGVFNAQEGGFFEIGRLSFGANLNKGDIIQAVMQLEGIENVQIEIFKRCDSDSADAGDCIVLEESEVAVCDVLEDAEESEESVSDALEESEDDEVALSDGETENPRYGSLMIQCSGGLRG